MKWLSFETFLAALYSINCILTLGQCVGFLTDYVVIHCNQGTCIKCQKMKFVSELSVNFISLPHSV